MLVRNLLLVLGGLAMLAGLALSAVWFSQTSRGPAPEAARAPIVQPAILIAARPIATGTLLRPEDTTWRDTGPGGIGPGNLVRGQISDTDLLGAVARRNFGAGEPLVASELVKSNERGFLAAALKPGARAVSIAVDAPQSVSGLILPDDRIDVLLIQSFGDSLADIARKQVGETVLTDLRVIAVDQSLNPIAKTDLADRRVIVSETQLPKLVTLEVSPRQAEVLLVASQLGRLGISVRALEGSGAETADASSATAAIWASDVSPALNELEESRPRLFSTGSGVEKSIRRVPPPGAIVAAPVAADRGATQ
jgi:pilus assembly protein CpaB